MVWLKELTESEDLILSVDVKLYQENTRIDFELKKQKNFEMAIEMMKVKNYELEEQLNS